MSDRPFKYGTVIGGPSGTELTEALATGKKIPFVLADVTSWQSFEVRGIVESVARMGTGFRVEFVTKCGPELGMTGDPLRLIIEYNAAPPVIGTAAPTTPPS